MCAPTLIPISRQNKWGESQKWWGKIIDCTSKKTQYTPKKHEGYTKKILDVHNKINVKYTPKWTRWNPKKTWWYGDKKNTPMTSKKQRQKKNIIKTWGHAKKNLIHTKINTKGTPKKHEGHVKWNTHTTIRISDDNQRKKNETHAKNNKKVCVETRYTH